jgi:hypothetical protein
VDLTHAEVRDPVVIVDPTDWRRIGENGMVTEGIHPRHLACLPTHLQAAVIVPVLFAC